MTTPAPDSIGNMRRTAAAIQQREGDDGNDQADIGGELS